LTRLGSAVVGMLMLVILAGCTSPAAKQTSNAENSHLRWLLKVRTHALSQGKPLKSKEDYKSYIQSLSPELRDRVIQGSGVSDVDELFVSERDGQPYVLFYGPPPAGVGADVVGYEQKGMDGKRYVGYSLGVVSEADEQRFNELVPPAARPKS
jgi:hypothetical protein